MNQATKTGSKTPNWPERQQTPSESHCSLATVLQQLQDFVALESRVATSQEMECRESRDYRAADRHRSFSLAMHKVRQRVRRIARDHMIRLDQ